MTPKPTKADKLKLGYVGSQPGQRDSASWFTPARYIQSVTAVLGGIGLDPFSSADANRIVKAKRFFSIEDNAFLKAWKAPTVFMNPPYSGTLCRQACRKFLEEWQAGNFQSGIVLVNNCTETQFFQELLRNASSV